MLGWSTTNLDCINLDRVINNPQRIPIFDILKRIVFKTQRRGEMSTASSFTFYITYDIYIYIYARITYISNPSLYYWIYVINLFKFILKLIIFFKINIKKLKD